MITDLDKMLSQSDLLLSPMDVILEEQRALLQNFFVKGNFIVDPFLV